MINLTTPRTELNTIPYTRDNDELVFADMFEYIFEHSVSGVNVVGMVPGRMSLLYENALHQVMDARYANRALSMSKKGRIIRIVQHGIYPDFIIDWFPATRPETAVGLRFDWFILGSDEIAKRWHDMVCTHMNPFGHIILMQETR